MPPATMPTKWRVSMQWTPQPGTLAPQTCVIRLMAFNANDMLVRAKMHAELNEAVAPITWGTPQSGW